MCSKQKHSAHTRSMGVATPLPYAGLDANSIVQCLTACSLSSLVKVGLAAVHTWSLLVAGHAGFIAIRVDDIVRDIKQHKVVGPMPEHMLVVSIFCERHWRAKPIKTLSA